MVFDGLADSALNWFVAEKSGAVASPEFALESTDGSESGSAGVPMRKVNSTAR